MENEMKQNQCKYHGKYSGSKCKACQRIIDFANNLLAEVREDERKNPLSKPLGE